MQPLTRVTPFAAALAMTLAAFPLATLGSHDFADVLLRAAAFAHHLQLTADETAVWIGAAFVFASSLSYALYLVGGGQMIARLGAARFTALAMLASTAATLIHEYTQARVLTFRTKAL